MRRDNTPWGPVTPASIEWSDAGDPVSTRFGDVYYSRDNGLEESRHVFLQGNELPQRWMSHPHKTFCIAETGFGTGLNFLLTWQAWRELPANRPALHYLSIEKYPLRREDLHRALAAWPSLEPLVRELLDNYPGLLPGQHRLILEQGKLCLDLWWEDIADALEDLGSREQPLVDAWYLDGFAPSRNEEMWLEDRLKAVATLSRPDSTFATFTAAGHVRRNLAAAGFDVSKVPGYGRKRECLRGRIESPAATASDPKNTPWDLPEASCKRPEKILVIGGGLAGCTVAAALARRGIAVTLLEQDRLANAGSGNDQGILYTRLSRKHSSLTDFALQSFRFATTYYRRMFQCGLLEEGSDGALCGSFHQSANKQEMSALAPVLDELPELAQVLGSEQAREVLGIEQESAGYWYPESGWLRPVSVCQALVNDSAIEVRENCGAITLAYQDGQWRAMSGGDTLASAPGAVVATGTSAIELEQFSWLPLQAIRGQTTHLPTTAGLSGLRAAFCHQGYIAPAREGQHCIGATFILQDDSLELREEEHRSNLQGLASAVPAWRAGLESLDPASLKGRVGYRCASPDYLPLAGPAPQMNAFLHKYGPLRKNARQTINSRGDYMPGLFLSTGHGSRGLTSTPLVAELLASQICGEAPPISRELSRALAPARFIIRNLCRNRV